jgi:hypothetical protein
MVATTEPAMQSDGTRSLKRKKQIRMFNPGPKQDRLGQTKSITPGSPGRNLNRREQKGFEQKVTKEAKI